jgi:putative endonuclease
MNWQVYILLCSDKSLYTGITTDVERRVNQHASGSGAKYFRGRKPKKLLYIEVGYSRGEATKREAEIKNMSRAEKLRLIVGKTA